MMSKQLQSLSFETTVKKRGNSGGIYLPVSLVGKRVKVTIEVL
jgi:putative transposon-encoded protein